MDDIFQSKPTEKKVVNKKKQKDEDLEKDFLGGQSNDDAFNQYKPKDGFGFDQYG